MTSQDPILNSNGAAAPPDHMNRYNQGNFSNHHPEPYLSQSSTTRLMITLVLNFFVPAIQLVGGFFANSVALISDAVHNFSDFTAIFISYISLRISQKGATIRHTFGYQRAEIIGALLNVAILVCAVIFIVYEAISRLYHPQSVSGKLVIIMAGAGIVGNGLSAWLLYRDSKRNLNIKGAFLHMLGDFLTSVMVLIIGAILMFRPWYWLDPVLSFLIAVFIIKNCWAVMAEGVSILMNATPKGLDLRRIQEYLESRPEIQSAHDLHAWNIGSRGIAFSCHLTVVDRMISDTEILAEKIRRHLFLEFGIDHPVLQFETAECGNGDILCELSKSKQKSEPVSSGDNFFKSLGKLNFPEILTVLIRLILGGIFIYAGAPKIYYPTEFAEALNNYQMLPAEMVTIAAIVLPWVEVIVGGMLVVGFWMPGTVIIYNGLMVMFICALAYNIYRGLDIKCGCFASSDEDIRVAILRDIPFLCMSLYLYFFTYFKKPDAGSQR